MHHDGATLARRFLSGQEEAVRIVEGWIRSSAGSFRRRLGTDWEDAVQESLLEQGTVGTLLDLVGRCPEHCRDLWQMILEGLSYREMSERTGLAEGTLRVRVRVLRCRRLAQDVAREREQAGDLAGKPAGDRNGDSARDQAATESPADGQCGTCDESVTNGGSGRRNRGHGKDHAG